MRLVFQFTEQETCRRGNEYCLLEGTMLAGKNLNFSLSTGTPSLPRTHVELSGYRALRASCPFHYPPQW